MGVIYTDPPEHTDEKPTVAESANECQWIGVQVTDYTDDVDLEEKGSGAEGTPGGFDNETNPYEDDIDEIFKGETS